MEDRQALAVQKTSMPSICDGSSPRKKKRKTKPTLLHDKYLVLDEMPLDELHEDILERVLARLPVSSFLQFRSVCKGWSSLVESPSFLRACSDVPSRGPWFFMVDSKADDSIVYDTEVNKWHHIQRPRELSEGKSKPVASAGGLVCFRSSLGHFTICNPLTACCHKLPHLETAQTIHAITMVSYKTSYKGMSINGRSIMGNQRNLYSAKELKGTSRSHLTLFNIEFFNLHTSFYTLILHMSIAKRMLDSYCTNVKDKSS